MPDAELYSHIAQLDDSLRDDTRNTSNAIDDLGTDEPPRRSSPNYFYARDPAVRDAVRARASGRCEYCGTLGFAREDGTPYLECHHIIALAKDGADRMANVIALCPNDHREAHFGRRRDELERRMMQNVRSLQR